MGYAKVGDGQVDLDKDTNSFGGTSFPVQSSEEFVEVTYQYQLTPWCQLQPDFQYVFNPGGGILNPNTGQRVKDEAVIGIRTNILF
jgi:porin